MIRLGSRDDNPLMMCSLQKRLCKYLRVPRFKRRFKWAISTDSMLIPSGSHTTEPSMSACEATCVGSCNQFSWNSESHHCYTSDSTIVSGGPNPHVTSGCRHDRCTASCSCSFPPPVYIAHFQRTMVSHGRRDELSRMISHARVML